MSVIASSSYHFTNLSVWLARDQAGVVHATWEPGDGRRHTKCTSDRWEDVEPLNPVDDEVVTCIQCLGREFVACECAQNLVALRDALSWKWVASKLFK